MSYNVVFEGTGEENSNTKGVRTWTSFEDKEAFDQYLLRGLNGDIVVPGGEGVDEAEAIRLVEQTSVEDYFIGAIEGSIVNGRIDREILEMKVATLNAVLGRRGKEGDGYPSRLGDGDSKQQR